MAIIRSMGGRFVRGLALAATLFVAMAASASAQTPVPSPEAGTDIFGNMPGAVILLVPLMIGGALYLSYRLGRPDEDVRARREGAVSRALARREGP
jgi:hypothetical protein